ncbi:hypothetical protein DDV89_10060, partial [Campylobacter jejuni]
VLTLLLCGSCALALDPNLEKTKSATGIDLPTAKWNLPKELNEDGTIDETKMPKNSEYSKMVKMRVILIVYLINLLMFILFLIF